MTYRQEIEALITTFLYSYYQRYVEPLEIEHDELIDENIELRKEIKRLKNSDSSYRNIAIRLKKERDMYKRMYIESEKRFRDGNKNRIIQRSF